MGWWLAGAVAVPAIIYFMIVSPRFRYLATGLLILAAIGVYVLIANQTKEREGYREQQEACRQQQAEAERVRLQQQAEAERWATTAIRSDELALTDVSLNHGPSGWTLKGTITNNSKVVALGSVSFLVTVKDCPTNQQCKITGQENTATRTQSHQTGLFDDIPSGASAPLPSCAPSSSSSPHWVLDVLVPPGQVRLFESNEMAFRNMPPSSNPRWEYKITEIRAVR
jgi:hypothetical protein